MASAALPLRNNLSFGSPPLAAGTVVSCLGVSKSFDVLDGGSAWQIILGGRPALGRKIAALSDITLTVPKGKFVGVIGRNGAGKSTLLRVIGGIYSPDRGRIEVRGKLSGLYELGIVGHRQLSGRAYAERVLAIEGTPRAAISTLIADIEEFSELGPRLDDPLYTYSTGMAARLFFATATARTHDVYLIDEILSVGDQHFQAKCWARMRERLRGGASGVLVTHDWSAVLKLCEEAHILERGGIIRSGPSDQVVRSYLNADGSVPPMSGRARFALEPPTQVRWDAGRSAVLPLYIDVLEDIPVSLVFAIEQMNVGIGWEIVLNGVDKFVANRAGRYRAELAIPALPLAPGSYHLDLSLVRVNPADPLDREVLDGRGWLKGTSIKLSVEGTPHSGRARLPMVWTAAV